MFDIVTFGSATWDIRVRPKKFKLLKDNANFETGQGFCFNFGSKIDVEEINFTSGGGGTNTAATFSKQGFKTAFCGMVGPDLSGQEIINELKSLKIDARFVFKTKEKPTNHSIIISSDGEDRTILAYRGASEFLEKNQIPWKKLKAKWFYLAPLSGAAAENFEEIVNFAFENKIKIAVNPGNSQLSLPIEKLKEIFKKVDVLILNQEEASLLTKIDYQNETEIFKEIDRICPALAVMTKGGEGVSVSDGKYLYSAKGHSDRKIVDTTGAGDAFGSGFVSGIIKYGDTSASLGASVEKAIQLAMANAEGDLSEIGAKTGLLLKDAKFDPVPVLKQECGQNNLCIEKL